MDTGDVSHRHLSRRFAKGAVLYFVVVGVIGVLLRARFVAPVWPSLRFDHLVHAHSHVAYFGWASMALMAVIYKTLPDLTDRALLGASVVRWQLGLTHVVTLGALITFATGGYTPLSIVLSTFNVLLWYLFGWLYWRNVKALPRPLPVPLRYYHGAVALLLVSSLGTWLISVVTASGTGSVVGQQAGLNIFLTNFTDGWLLLGLLGTGAALVPGRPPRDGHGLPEKPIHARWAAGPLPWIVGLTPLTFLAELVPFGVSPGLLVLGLAARFGLAVPYVWFIWNAVVAYRSGGLGGYGRAGVSPPRALRMLVVASLGFFVAKAGIHTILGLAAVVPSRQIFIAYLHLDLLGFVSCGLLAGLYFMFDDIRSGVSTAKGRFDAGLWGAALLAAGTVMMVVALAAVGMVGGTTDSVGRAIVNGLLQAAFVLGVVAFIGILLSVIGLNRHMRRPASSPRKST